jgi:hypothetical protein
MGIPGVNFGSCYADGGDDGRLQHTPHGANCDSAYPLFLSYNGDAKSGAPLTDSAKFANDVSCIAALGTEGCGSEEQLEAPFKALTPYSSDYTFLSITEQGTHGKGDLPEDMGGNLGFLRNDPAKGPSLIAVVVVTDEEDCSVRTSEHLWPRNILPPGSPYIDEDINLRCFLHKEFLFDLKSRYYEGFRKLRPGHEDQVVFAGIVGVPVDTVDRGKLSAVNFSDERSRNAFYDDILNDPRMQEEIDPSTNPGSGTGNLKPSCIRQVDGEDRPALAYPPRRIVELARMFGPNGMVQSICQDDFGPAMDAITNVIASRLGESCLPNKLMRQSDGRVGCTLTWELPKDPIQGSGAPTECAQLPFLQPVDAGQPKTNDRGGNNCKVTQLPVADVASASGPAGEGWFYDDFTDELERACRKDQPQRIAFTSAAKPPAEVNVRLDCQTTISKVANTAKNLESHQPQIGSNCGPSANDGALTGDDACVIALKDGSADTSMFCHRDFQACVRSCQSDSECPKGWRCDNRPDTVMHTDGRAYCVDTKCSSALR